jgi:alpha-methylacyl-CoA racemase
MGPLSGYKMIEIVGIGPCPFAAMMLADMGAEILRIDRHGGSTSFAFPDPSVDFLARGRRSIGVDLKHPEGVALLLRLLETCDALLEGFRPGVMERLGLGPDVCLERNPGLVYGRMTGWGQDGPLADAPGHDINYISLAGALHHIGRAGAPPTPPLNLVGDFGGGGMLLAFGVLAALLERARSGRGQVVDAAMVDGAALLMAPLFGANALGGWGERGSNLLDSGAPFYDVYETGDGKYISIGSLEPQFYADLLRRVGLEGEDLAPQMDGSGWPALRERLREIFKSKTRDEWCVAMEGAQVCFAPVLSMTEAPENEHNKARETFVEVAGRTQPGPAPRFSRTPPEISRPPAMPGDDVDEALAQWGVSIDEAKSLRDAGAIG